MNNLGPSQIGLTTIVVLIPIVGFVMTLGYARKGNSRREQRWRKRHGLLYWVLIPGVAGMATLFGYLGLLPGMASLIGIVALSGSALVSWSIQQKHQER